MSDVNRVLGFSFHFYCTFTNFTIAPGVWNRMSAGGDLSLLFFIAAFTGRLISGMKCVTDRY